MFRQLRAAAIHDISGFGKCSLTVALPILSAAGIETAVLPTAVLSLHTAVGGNFTYRDLTQDLSAFAQTWKDANLEFDAIYSGFLGSAQQVGLVCDIFDLLSSGGTLKVVDPAMADNGKMYSLFDRSFALEMKKLCKKADLILPNFTEAAFLLDEEYQKPPYTKETVHSLLKRLSDTFSCDVVLTGVSYEPKTIGAASYQRETEHVNEVFTPHIDGIYHGTGDVFASVLTAALINGRSLSESTGAAAIYTYESVERTFRLYPDIHYGVDFESGLYQMKDITSKRGVVG